ncbi:unnamed protein product [Pieris macdunnoughi]|uniref:Uncharacterized protein n=1 Tax=Pieris macdunnoughi TaxID=345717 RepID=A0A821WCL9_9NEOP|nr:unnamed protein product [Pieris macdunnoughi]
MIYENRYCGLAAVIKAISSSERVNHEFRFCKLQRLRWAGHLDVNAGDKGTKDHDSVDVASVENAKRQAQEEME